MPTKSDKIRQTLGTEVQYHPEFTSNRQRPAPLFVGLIRAALARKSSEEQMLRLSPMSPKPSRSRLKGQLRELRTYG